MTTNFNQYPYFDDYINDTENNIHDKNFHRILFKPGVAVQARELTQTQSILQDQIKKFGDHVFKNHSVVSGGEVTTNLNVYYVRLEENDLNGSAVDVQNFLNKNITDESNVISGKVIVVEQSPEPLLVVAYYTDRKFISGEEIYIQGEEFNAKVLSPTDGTDASGLSSTCTVTDGIYYIDGYFVQVAAQSVYIDKYSNTPTARVGLLIEESIVNSFEDSSLLDPALGSSNFQAPGADRYKIYLRLAVKPMNYSEEDKNFVELVRMEAGKIQKSVRYPEYSEIDKYFARRTFDTNGNFIVNKFNIDLSENESDSSKYYVKLGPGKAYVDGFIVENQSDITFSANKARNFANVTNKQIFMNYGNYLYTENLKGGFDFNSYQPVDFHVTTPNYASLESYRSTLAASGKIKNVKFFGYTDAANSATYKYETYITELQNFVYTANAVSVSMANSISGQLATIKFPAQFPTTDSVYNGVYIRINTGNDAGDLLRIVTNSGNTAYLENNFKAVPESNCNFSLVFDTKDFEYICSSNTTVLAGLGSNSTTATISKTSKLGAVDSGDTYLRNAGDAGLIYELGNDYVVNGSIDNSEYYTWIKFTSVNIGTAVSVPNLNDFVFMSNNGTLDDSDAAQNFICIYKSGGSYSAGKLVPFVSNTASPYHFTATVGSVGNPSSQVTFNGNTITGSLDVYARVKVIDGNDVNLTRKRKTLTLGNESALGTFDSTSKVTGTSNIYFSSTYGQTLISRAEFNSDKQSLYCSDVKRILKVIDTRSNTIPTDPSILTNSNLDVTRYYNFNNGQTDNLYDHSYLKLLPNGPLPTGYLLVIFDYYEHNGNGYFDVNSYVEGGESYETIPTYTDTKGNIYELRDCIDFRKTRTNKTTTFAINQYGTSPSGIPVDGTVFETDYSYYLGRKDLLIVGKDKDFKLIEGPSSLNPIEPNQPDGSMVIAKFTLDPYTLRVSSDSRGALYSSIKVQKMIYKRWRMEDITSLEERVSRVEYYTVLNSLEQSAKNLQIPDETGTNRFKNGIITDDFSSYLVADVSASDFYASIQTVKKRLFAIHNIKNFDLVLRDGVKTFGALSPTTIASIEENKGYTINYDGEDSYVTLPFTKVNAAVQPFASSVFAVNPASVIDIKGDVALTPQFDAWVSSTKLPDIRFTTDTPVLIQSNSVNRLTAGDMQTVVGADVNSSANNISLSPSDSSFDGFVTDVTLNPWIRGQQIRFVAKNLSRNTPVRCYFDGVNVTNRIRKLNKLSINPTIATAFESGSVLAINGSSTPFALVANRSSTVTVNGTGSQIVNDVFGDLDSTEFTPTDSNLINSVYIGPDGIGTEVRGIGEVQDIIINSGRILQNPTSTTIKIRSFGPYQNVNNIIDGLTYIDIVDEESTNVYQYTINNWVDNGDGTITLTTASDITVDDVASKRYFFNIKQTEQLVTDNDGTLCGVFYLPPDTFHTGDRVFRIDNRVADNIGTETTFAETKFFATNLNYDKRGISIDIPVVPAPPPPPPEPICKDEDKVTVSWNLRWIGVASNNTQERYHIAEQSGALYPWKNVNIKDFTSNVLVEPDPTNPAAIQYFDSRLQIVSENKDCASAGTIIYDPLAQTFIFYKEQYPFGCFIKSIKVFFRNKPENYGPSIACYLTETLNGYPTKTQIPHAISILRPDQVNVSENPSIYDSSTYTVFEFPIPIYVKPDTMYAFVLKSISNEYFIYSARQGDFALPSTTKTSIDATAIQDFKISQTPYIGDLFKSANAETWSPEPNEDIMFVIERCEFDTTKTPAVEFVVPEYLPQRKLVDHSIDFNYGSNTYIGAAYTANTDFVVDAFNISTTDLAFTEAPVQYSYRATLNFNRTKELLETYISPGKYGTTNFQEILLDDGKGERVLTYDKLSSGAYSFSLYAYLRSNYSTISPMISEMGLSLFGVKWNINDLGISNTDIKIVGGGSGYTNSSIITVSRTSNVVTSNVIVGSTAVLTPSVNSTGAIVNVSVNSPGSYYVTNPVITITDPYRGGNSNATILIAGETSSIGGNGVLRYISKPVTLAPDFDAGDFRVYYTAYRPVNTNIFVYYKILNRNDTQSFEDSDWQLMTTISGGSLFSKKRDQLYEYIAAPYIEPNYGIPANKVSYTSKITGQQYNLFSKFAIKIVTTSSDPTVIPYLTDVRGVALYPIG